MNAKSSGYTSTNNEFLQLDECAAECLNVVAHDEAAANDEHHPENDMLRSAQTWMITWLNEQSRKAEFLANDAHGCLDACPTLEQIFDSRSASLRIEKATKLLGNMKQRAGHLFIFPSSNFS